MVVAPFVLALAGVALRPPFVLLGKRAGGRKCETDTSASPRHGASRRSRVPCPGRTASGLPMAAAGSGRPRTLGAPPPMRLYAATDRQLYGMSPSCLSTVTPS